MRRSISGLVTVATLVFTVSPAQARSSGAPAPLPLSYFRLPGEIAGPSHFFAGEGGSGPQVPPADMYESPQTLADLGTYRYGVRPNVSTVNGGAQAFYEVTVYKTIEAARAANAENRDNINDGSGQPFAPLVITQPLNDNEWLRGRHAANMPGRLFCSTVSGVRYRNLRVYTFLQNFQSPAAAGTVPCAVEGRWALRVMQAIYPRLVSFASVHPALATLSAPTAIRVVDPFDSHGRLRPGYDYGYKASAPRPDTSCASSSFVSGSPNAYRCVAGSQISDPCFAPPVAKPTIVACVRDPRVTYAEIFHLASPLPAHHGAFLKPGQGLPWGFDLTTAEQCGFEGGATFAVGTLRLNYGCAPGGVVYGDVDQKGRLWTVLVWRGSQSATPSLSQLVRVGVTVAYY